ncbi:guanine nucleotide-binding subunit beta 1 isoform X3 [Labeo rohita]|uniref:Guanine nucleotide-binding subunit beta 1 isoform X3 n=1 Tax=Labeo rohita TaxID=84645 RepID=A0A498NGD0_LABRO|nr:guanine nucleotide-binding subunit beta 1 isoform X3 [Labeo rohita]
MKTTFLSELKSQGRDMRVCMWDVSEDRSTVTDSLLTGSVGFCQCSLLETRPGAALLAHPTGHMEEVSVVEMRSWTPVCSLKPDSKLGMLMCMKIWQMHDSVQMTNPGVSQLRVRADGKILATAGWDNNIRVFGWKKLKPLAVLQHHTDMISDLCFFEI